MPIGEALEAEGGSLIMTQIIYQVDSFTTRPYAGNPAGVCMLASPADAEWMQSVAREMNLSETAFLYPKDEGYHLRWFTPESEVDLCGHATLATAHILWEKDIIPADKKVLFYTNSGELTCSNLNKGIEMDFPATPPEAYLPPAGLVDAIGAEPEYVGKNIFDVLVVVSDEQTVRSLNPDFGKIVQLGVRGVIVTSKSESPEYDIVSRYFAPSVGINEDPVTGSAHCTLGPYWTNVLNKNPIKAYQASARGGEVGVEVVGDRVKLVGQAITVMEITLL